MFDEAGRVITSRSSHPAFPRTPGAHDDSALRVAMILLDPSARPIVAHRGASGAAPENTLPAFDLAVTQAVDAIELDVHVTADDVAVVMHDPTVDRTTSGSGAIAGMTLRQLRELDAGYRFTADAGATFPYRAQRVRVPTVEDVLERIPREMPVIIEVKSVAAQWALRRVLERFKVAPRCLVASFEANALGAFQDANYARVATRRDLMQLIARTAVGMAPSSVTYRAICPPTRYHGIPVPIAMIARAAARVRVPVHVWTVDDPREALSLWRKGVSGIISNAPARILEARPPA